MSYPNIISNRRMPNPDRDGEKNYGKPCVICGSGTVGEKWVQVSWFRGDDELIRVCALHWKEHTKTLLEAAGYKFT